MRRDHQRRQDFNQVSQVILHVAHRREKSFQPPHLSADQGALPKLFTLHHAQTIKLPDLATTFAPKNPDVLQQPVNEGFCGEGKAAASRTATSGYGAPVPPMLLLRCAELQRLGHGWDHIRCLRAVSGTHYMSPFMQEILTIIIASWILWSTIALLRIGPIRLIHSRTHFWTSFSVLYGATAMTFEFTTGKEKKKARTMVEHWHCSSRTILGCVQFSAMYNIALDARRIPNRCQPAHSAA